MDQQEKALRKLSRKELLELLVQQGERIEALETELAETRAALEKKEIAYTEAGSLAEAALRINKVFEDADAAAHMYLSSIRQAAAPPAEGPPDTVK